jgi:hypothetical protein
LVFHLRGIKILSIALFALSIALFVLSIALFALFPPFLHEVVE